MHEVTGALYFKNFITEIEEEHLIACIDENVAGWLTDLKRRVQHYGYRYSYYSKLPPEYLGPLPKWLN